MAQLGNAGQGYIAVTVQVTTAAANLLALVNTLFAANGIPAIPASYRQIQIQIDPESGTENSVRIGSANVGTSLSGITQKGATLAQGSDDNINSIVFNGAYFGSLWAQGVGGNQTVNIQLWKA